MFHEALRLSKENRFDRPLIVADDGECGIGRLRVCRGAPQDVVSHVLSRQHIVTLTKAACTIRDPELFDKDLGRLRGFGGRTRRKTWEITPIMSVMCMTISAHLGPAAIASLIQPISRPVDGKRTPSFKKRKVHFVHNHY